DAAALDDSLISAVDAAERPSSSQPAFLPVMLNEATRRVRALDASRLIEPAEIRRRGLYATVGSVALLLVVVVSLASFERAVDTARPRFFPGSVQVQVDPGDVRVAIGTPVRIRASVHRRAGRVLQLAPTLTVFANGQHRAVPMASAADAFEYVIESVDRTFSYD